MDYYGDNDPKVCVWLRELIKQGHLPEGVVDERDIKKVKGEDLRGYRRVHLFAGIGGWAYALQLAGWPDDRPVWTGSCPCQPFSVAGKRKSQADERNLWPEMLRLVRESAPATVFGEQVAGIDGFEWLARVQDDLEDEGYAFGAADLCAAGAGAPHLRQRYFFVADAISSNRIRISQHRTTNGTTKEVSEKIRQQRIRIDVGSASHVDTAVVNANGHKQFWWSGPLQVGRNTIQGEVERGGRKYRAQWRIKPGLCIVAHGIPGRVEQLRGFGNAIVPQVAAKFIQAFLEISKCLSHCQGV